MAATHESKFRTQEFQQEGADAAKRARGGHGKKCLALLLALPLALALSACDVNIFTDTVSDLTEEDSTDDDGNITVTVETSEEDDEAEADEEAEADDGTVTTYDPVTFFDQDGISLTVTGIEEGSFCVYLDISIVNDTDSDIIVSTNEDFANGDKMEDTGLIYEIVAAGKTSDKQLAFYDIDSADELTEVSGSFTIYDEDSYTTLYEPELSLVVS